MQRRAIPPTQYLIILLLIRGSDHLYHEEAHIANRLDKLKMSQPHGIINLCVCEFIMTFGILNISCT